MYIFNGICHYLFTNNGRTTATWNINSIECSIKGDISLDEMKEIINDIYKKLHDLDYFLLRYGPKDVAKYVEDDSTVSKYYGTLPFY